MVGCGCGCCGCCGCCGGVGADLSVYGRSLSKCGDAGGGGCCGCGGCGGCGSDETLTRLSIRTHACKLIKNEPVPVHWSLRLD